MRGRAGKSLVSILTSRVIIVAGLALLLPGIVRADILAEIPMSITAGTRADLAWFESFDGMVFEFQVSPDGQGQVRTSAMFDGLLLTPANVGTTIFATSATDPAFDEIISMLTNGIDDYMLISTQLYGSGGTYFVPESEIFADISFNGVDLAGYDISAIGVRLDSMPPVDIPGSDPNGDGLWGDYSAEMALVFVPEPATMSLLALGSLAVLRRRKP